MPEPNVKLILKSDTRGFLSYHLEAEHFETQAVRNEVAKCARELNETIEKIVDARRKKAEAEGRSPMKKKGRRVKVKVVEGGA